MQDNRFAQKPLVRRLRLKNYKSIGVCDIALGPLAILVGPNGSGKSNVIDSLRFVTDALRDNLDLAFRNRGGIDQVRRKSTGHPHNISVDLELNLPGNREARYAFEIGAQSKGAFCVTHETCQIVSASEGKASFEVHRGQLTQASQEIQAVIEPDRLYLGIASGLPAFRPLYDALTRMAYCNINPKAIQSLQEPGPASVLSYDGGNIAGIVRELPEEDKHRIEQYLGAIVPGILGVNGKTVGHMETLEFRQEVRGSENPWRFLAASMSDGTLRALGLLVALLPSKSGKAPFVAIEEPESALHPGATFTLTEAILEAAETKQVLLATHSPELLDHEGIEAENLIAVENRQGNTIAKDINTAAKEVLREKLSTPGELQRREQLYPEEDPESADRDQTLFDQAKP